MSSSGSNSAVVLELAEQFLERYRQGQRPSLKEYIDKHPKLAKEIKEVFPAMAMMENIALADESLAGKALGGQPFEGPQTLERLGDYRIIREVGRGGMGVVYEAEQVSLGRHVALKVLPNKALTDSRQKLRFEREAKAAAKLHHTNIVPVFGVGEHDGLPYYVMQFIQGLGMNEVLEELKHIQGNGTPAATGELPVSRRNQSAADVARSLLTGRSASDNGQSLADPNMTADQTTAIEPGKSVPLVKDPSSKSGSLSGSSVVLPGQSEDGSRTGKRTYWQSIANIGAQVAGALDYAHHQGILHRDIKPSNLLLDTRGTVWVTDFGLAKTDDAQNLTTTGDLLGTLRYMPPEAFEGRSDRRGDIYALGLTLYELLAMRPAYEEKDRHRLIKQVTSSEPDRLDTVNSAIPRDLVTIVHKAIDRDPAHRYPSAGELAADLRRYLDDEPIHARRLSGMERCARWCRRNPLVASLTAAIVLVTVLGFGATVHQMLAAQENARVIDEQRDDMAKQLEVIKGQTVQLENNISKQNVMQIELAATLYGSRMSLLQIAEAGGNHARVKELLVDQKPKKGEPDARGWEWWYLDRMHNGLRTVSTGAALSTDARLSDDGRVLYEINGPKQPKKATQDKEIVKSRPVIVKRFDAKTGKLLQSPLSLKLDFKTPDNETPPTSLQDYHLSRDGTRLAVRSRFTKAVPQIPANLTIFDLATGKQVTDIALDEATSPSPAFSQDGELVALHNGRNGPLKVWRVSMPKLPVRMLEHKGRMWGLTFSPDGAILAGFSQEGKDFSLLIWDLWDLEASKPTMYSVGINLKIPTVIGGAQPEFSPGGDWVAAEFQPADGPKTASHLIYIFSVESGKAVKTISLPASVNALATHKCKFSPDGRHLAVHLANGTQGTGASAYPEFWLWDVQTGAKLQTFRGYEGLIRDLAFSEDGRRLIAVTAAGIIKEWDVAAVDLTLSRPAAGPMTIGQDWKRIAIPSGYAGPAKALPKFKGFQGGKGPGGAGIIEGGPGGVNFDPNNPFRNGLIGGNGVGPTVVVDPCMLFEAIAKGTETIAIADAGTLRSSLEQWARHHNIMGNAISSKDFAAFVIAYEIEPSAKKYFTALDRDDNGKLSADEMPAELKNLWKQYDKNGDGLLDFEEFKPWYQTVYSAMSHAGTLGLLGSSLGHGPMFAASGLDPLNPARIVNQAYRGLPSYFSYGMGQFDQGGHWTIDDPDRLFDLLLTRRGETPSIISLSLLERTAVNRLLGQWAEANKNTSGVVSRDEFRAFAKLYHFKLHIGGSSQFGKGGKGGGLGGGKSGGVVEFGGGGFNDGGIAGWPLPLLTPQVFFNQLANGADKIAIANTGMLSVSLNKWAEANNITDGEITRAQFMEFALKMDPKDLKALTLTHVAIYDLNGEELFIYKKHTGSILHVALSPDGKYAATVGYKDNKNPEEQELRLWNTENGKESLKLKITSYHPPPKNAFFSPSNFNPRAFAPAFSPDGKKLAVINMRRDGERLLYFVEVYDVATGKLLVETTRVEGRFQSIASALRLENAAGDILVMTGGICSVEFSLDGKSLVTMGGWQSGVTAWDLAKGTSRWHHPAPAHFPAGCSFSPDGSRLAITLMPAWVVGPGLTPFLAAMGPFSDSEVRVLDWATGKEMATFCKDRLIRNSILVWSYDGKGMAVDTDLGLELWDVARNEKRFSFPGHRDATAMAFSPDGRRLATLSTMADKSPGYVKIWDLTTGHELFSIKLDTEFDDIRFSPDGHRLMLTSNAGTARVVRVLDATPVPK